jgi:hypothetical protein
MVRELAENFSIWSDVARFLGDIGHLAENPRSCQLLAHVQAFEPFLIGGKPRHHLELHTPLMVLGEEPGVEPHRRGGGDVLRTEVQASGLYQPLRNLQAFPGRETSITYGSAGAALPAEAAGGHGRRTLAVPRRATGWHSAAARRPAVECSTRHPS